MPSPSANLCLLLIIITRTELICGQQLVSKIRSQLPRFYLPTDLNYKNLMKQVIDGKRIQEYTRSAT